MRMLSTARVVEVTPNVDRSLDIVFDDGKSGTFDMAPYIEFPAFEPLKDLGVFMQARVEAGTVVWNDEIDIAPERLYSDLRE